MIEIINDRELIKNEIKFATFGCWNKGCIEGTGQFYVSKLLKEKENNYDFLIILGDNYYGKITIYEKDGQKEYIFSEDDKQMKNGFACIDKINLPKKLIMGNHDVMETVGRGCSGLKLQLKMPWYDVKFPFNFDYYYFLNSEKKYEAVLIIYVDTSLYSDNIKDDCYKYTTGKTKNELKINQKLFIDSIIKKAITEKSVSKILICGHEPLLVYRRKYHETEFHTVIIKDLIDILFENIQKYSKVKFTYVCADYHIYQNTKIKKNGLELEQFIFGTGGGILVIESCTDTKVIKEQDGYTVSIEPNEIYDKDNKKLYINSNGHSAYGFGEITINSEGIKHRFIKSPEQPVEYPKQQINGGNSLNNEKYKEKYLKYKNKYLQLKLNM